MHHTSKNMAWDRPPFLESIKALLYDPLNDTRLKLGSIIIVLLLVIMNRQKSGRASYS